jgi:hypothetical protein
MKDCRARGAAAISAALPFREGSWFPSPSASSRENALEPILGYALVELKLQPGHALRPNPLPIWRRGTAWRGRARLGFLARGRRP